MSIRILLLFILIKPALILKAPRDLFEKCVIHTKEFWSMYGRFYASVRTLSITVLQDDEYKFDLNRFIQKAIKIMNEQNDFLSVTIREKFKQNSTFGFKRGNVIIRQNTSESIRGHAIFTSDVQTLNWFLNEEPEMVIPQSRDKYSLHFLFFQKSCKQINEEIDYVLKRFWNEFWVVDIVAQTPCNCKKSYFHMFHPFIKIKNTWGLIKHYNYTSFTKYVELILNQYRNLNGYPLNISLFPRTPTSMIQIPKFLKQNLIYKNTTFSFGMVGLDAKILISLVENLNFKPLKNSVIGYGKLLKNGTITETLGEVAYGRSFFGANNRLLLSNYFAVIDYTIPYLDDEICVAVPKADKKSKWIYIFHFFDDWSTRLIATICIIAGIFWRYNTCSKSLIKASLGVYAILWGVPFKIVTPAKYSFFCMLSFLLLLNIIITAILQGLLFKKLSKNIYYDDINTLDDFFKANLSLSEFLLNIIPAENEAYKKLKLKSIGLVEDSYKIAVQHKNLSILDTKEALEVIIKSEYLDENGLPLLHIINECLCTQLDANILPKGSPFLIPFNNVLRHLMEGGLIRKWQNDFIDSMIMEKMIKAKRKEQLRALSKEEINDVFEFIVAGWSLATAAFLGEILFQQIVNLFYIIKHCYLNVK